MVRFTPVATFSSSTAAFGITAPDGSLTTPETWVVAWAQMPAANAARSQSVRRIRFIVAPVMSRLAR